MLRRADSEGSGGTQHDDLSATLAFCASLPKQPLSARLRMSAAELVESGDVDEINERREECAASFD